MQLCDGCAEKLREAYQVTLSERDVTKKVKCAHCGENAYGGYYTVSVRRKEGSGKNGVR